jgi:energy-coupling factor transport system substrate-specific component
LDKKLSVMQVTLFGMLGALTFGAKFIMSGLPNIEPVSLLVMVYAVTLGPKALYPIYVYVMLEILVYGLGDWNVMYLYIWPLLWLVAWLLRRMKNPLGWAILSGTFGLLFGALCSPVYYFMGGWTMVAAKWVSGLSFDLLHCAGNFTMALLLFVPLRKLMGKLYRPIKTK